MPIYQNLRTGRIFYDHMLLEPTQADYSIYQTNVTLWLKIARLDEPTVKECKLLFECTVALLGFEHRPAVDWDWIKDVWGAANAKAYSRKHEVPGTKISPWWWEKEGDNGQSE